MKARRFALIGDPVAHSKSPAMHAAAYRAMKLPHTYEAIRALPEDVPAVVERLRKGDLDGLNVTVPHKRRVLDHVDILDYSARLAGAANTLVAHEDGKIAAYNTDTLALAEEIARLAPDMRSAWEKGAALVLGSGGAARSAVAALSVELGVPRVIVRGRTFDDPAARQAFEREVANVVAQPWRADAGTEKDVLIVVQATSAGMTGKDPGDEVARVVAWDELPARAVAIDVIYAPPETPFLAAASAHGIRCSNGFGMLARQGALAFELWLGLAAPYNAMLAALM